MTFGWEGGRKLTSFSTPNAVGNYVYNADGIRVYKEVNGNTTEYYLNGTQIQTEITNFGGVTRRVDYIYDENGSVYGFVVDNTNKYYYTKNLQGDIIGILDNTGTQIVEYSYDAWGKATVSYPNADSLTKAQKQANYFLGSNNPFRYRGYYFDNETGFYYLNSRYYDPEVGRFINADSQLNLDQGLLGANLFTYCLNNSVNMVDRDGYAAINVIFAAIGAVVGWPLGDFVAKKLGYYSGWKYWAIRAGVVVGGAVIGWFAGSLMAKIIANYLKTHSAVIFKITNKLGATGFYSAMKFLGINPFSLAMDNSKFIAIARLFNTKAVTISYDWAIKLYSKAKSLGFNISLDRPHGGYTWHIHINGGNGKLRGLHIQIVKKAWDYLSKLL